MATNDMNPAFRALLVESRARLDEATRLVKAAEMCAESDATGLGIDLFSEVARNLDQAKQVLDAAATVHRLSMT